jgi:hypothetical protein
MLKQIKGKVSSKMTLILTGDHLYYVNESSKDNLHLILLSEATMHRNNERNFSFEIRSNHRKFVISCK